MFTDPNMNSGLDMNSGLALPGGDPTMLPGGGDMPVSPDTMGNIPPPPPMEEPPVSQLDPQNLALNLSPEVLNTLGSLVVDYYNADIQSRTEWSKRASNYFKLFAGYRELKNTPWTGCSNVSVPLLGISSLQFQARAYDALIPAKEVAKCYATDGKSIDIAERTSKYLNYQLFDEMEEWEEDMDTMLLALPIFGSSVKKTYYSFSLERPVSRFLNIDEFVAPYRCRRLEDASRKTHMFHLPLNDIKIKANRGEFVKEAFDLPSDNTSTNEDTPEYNRIVDKVTGQVESSNIQMDTRFILEQHLMYDLDNDGLQEPYIVTVDYKTRQVLSVQKRWIQDKWQPNIDVPVEFFTAYTFIPNPASWMGFGFGHLLEGLNESANTIINQLIDAGSLANLAGKSGLISKRSGLRKGNIDITLGQFKEVDLSNDDIKKAIYTYEFREPSGTLFNLLGLLKAYSQEVSSVSDALLGKLPPSDTTATSMLAVMEQGMKMFSVIHKRLHRSLRKELKKIFYINSIYLNETVYFTVQDSNSKAITTLQSGKIDFNSNIDVKPTSDPTITSRAEKLIRARTVYDIAMQNPLISQNPESLFEITRQLLVANEVQNVDTILQLPPPPPPPPDLSPQTEHAHFLSELAVEPLPQQDSFFHLNSHLTFRDSNWGTQLTSQGKNLLNDHIMKTKALAYLQQETLNDKMRGSNLKLLSGGNNDRIGGLEGMATPTPNEGVPSGAEGSAGWVNVGLPQVE